MILILSSNTDQQGADYQQLMAHLAGLPAFRRACMSSMAPSKP